MLRNLTRFLLDKPVQVGATPIIAVLVAIAIYNGAHPLEILIRVLFRIP